MANFWGGIEHSSTSVIFRCNVYKADDGQGFTGLTNSSSGLIISTITDNEASATVYAQGSSNIEAISTLATYSAPSANKCAIKLVDDTNHPGLIEIQFADARWAVTDAKDLFITISGVSNLLAQAYRVSLYTITLDDISTRMASDGFVTQSYLDARTRISAEYAQADDIDAIGDTLSNIVDGTTPATANIIQVNGVTVSGTGANGDEWGPA